MATFNPNELILDRIRTVEEYDPSTDEIIGRYTQIEEPQLSLSADSTEVVDAKGVPIATFYQAQKGTFSFTNSLFSLDLAASQFGSTKTIASESAQLTMPVSETIVIGAGATVTLKYVPVGTTGAEIKYVKVINADNCFGETFTVSATAGAGKFTIDASNRLITLPEGTTGKVFVKYNKKTSTAVKISKVSDGVPEVRKLLINAIFRSPCNKNVIYAGVIECPRAQIDPSSIELNLTSDGKHAAAYQLQRQYCDDAGELFNIMVSED